MENLANKKLETLRERLKAYDGAINEWVKRCKVSQPAFGHYFKESASTARKKEVYMIGLRLLDELMQKEIDEFETMEKDFALARMALNVN
jgi:hypothetical protein